MSKRIQTATLSLTLGVCLALMPSSADAIERAEIQAANTASPRDTLRSFIDACNEVHELIQREKYLDRDSPEHARVAARVLDCIDMGDIPAFTRKHRAAEVAVCIKEILDRVELPAWEDIPDLQAIDAAGGFEELSLWRIPRTRITIDCNGR